MSNQTTFKPATRQGVKPLIGLYGESGSGKTFTALLLARGIAGAAGRIGMIDSESGRGSLYADVLPGGYQTMEIVAPFSPETYIRAINAAEAEGFDVVVIDSGSHEWEGIGGVLDIAGENEAAGKKGLAVWKAPKMEHAKFMLKLLQTRLPVIVCLRAKYKSRQVKGTKEMAEAGLIRFNDVGKNSIVKDEHLTPIQAEDFIFEMMAHAEIQGDHTIRLTKCSHPALRECFPKDRTEPIGITHGQAIAAWAAGGRASGPQKPPADSEIVTLKRELFATTKDAHRGDQEAFWQYLVDEDLIADTEFRADLSAARLSEVIAAVKAKKGALL